jgi:hypothetical protein
MIKVNLDKAKVIAHDKRRAARSEEFAPLDAELAKQIPGTNTEAIEAARQMIRDKYAVMQNSIDSAGDVAALTVIVASL